jgi:hypothetical protein
MCRVEKHCLLQLYLLGPTEYVPPEDGGKIQSPKCRIFNKKTGRWMFSRIAIVILIYLCRKLIDIIYMNVCQKYLLLGGVPELYLLGGQWYLSCYNVFSQQNQALHSVLISCQCLLASRLSPVELASHRRSVVDLVRAWVRLVLVARGVDWEALALLGHGTQGQHGSTVSHTIQAAVKGGHADGGR